MLKSLSFGLSSSFLVFALMPHAAYAQDHGFYAGVGATQITISGLGLGDITSDAAGIVAGYRFNQYVAVETDYTRATSMAQLGFVDVLQLNGVSGFVVGSYPVSDRLSLQGRVGVQNLKYRVRNSAIAAPIDIARRINDTHPAIGVGANWRLTDNINVNATYLRAGDDLFSSSIGSSQRISIGLNWHFGGQ